MSASVAVPGDAAEEDVNELLSHVGCAFEAAVRILPTYSACLQCGGCDVLPDCRESLAARQKGTDSVQGGPRCGPTLTSRAKARLSVCVSVCVCVCVCLRCMFSHVQVDCVKHV